MVGLAGPTTQLAIGSQFQDELLNVTVAALAYRWALPLDSFDVFIHSWATSLANEFISAWSPTAAAFENNSAVAGDIQQRLRPQHHDCHKEFRNFCPYNSASGAFSIVAVLRLVALHEDACQQRYNRVMLLRPDLIFTRKLDGSVLMPQTQVEPGSQIWLGHSDGATRSNRELGDGIFLLQSSHHARLMHGLFDYLDPKNDTRPTGWGCVCSIRHLASCKVELFP